MPTEIPGQQRLDFHQAVRDSLIDGLRLPARQAHLLKTLDRLMRDETGEPNVHTLKDDLGNLTIELPLAALALAMVCSEDTVRRAYRRLGGSPYLTIEEVAGRPHLFTVHWPAIVDDSVRPQQPHFGMLNREKGVAAKVARGRNVSARGGNAATPPGGVAAPFALQCNALSSFEQEQSATAARCDPSQRATPRPGRTGWEVAVEQLRDLAIVAEVLVPRAIATFRLVDCEATRDGILAAACCALKGAEPPKLFTFLVKRRAWECSGLDGIAEVHFDEVRAWKRQQEQCAAGLPNKRQDGYHAALSADAEFERQRAAALNRLKQFESAAEGGGRHP